MIRWGNLVLSPWDPETVTFLMFNMTGCVIKLQEFKFRLNVNFTTYALIEGMKMTSADWSYIFRCFAKVWFSLAHKYKHKHIHSSQWHIWLSSRYHWALSFPQHCDKQDGGRFVRHIAFNMFAWVLGQSGLWLVHDLVLMLVLMSTSFSLVKATT